MAIMATGRVERTDGGFIATNERGASVAVGRSDQDGVFSPVELLLAVKVDEAADNWLRLKPPTVAVWEQLRPVNL